MTVKLKKKVEGEYYYTYWENVHVCKNCNEVYCLHWCSRVIFDVRESSITRSGYEYVGDRMPCTKCGEKDYEYKVGRMAVKPKVYKNAAFQHSEIHRLDLSHYEFSDNIKVDPYDTTELE